MAQPLTPLALTAPGFYGLNTQDSPSDMDERFALEASNCVIDKSGRISSRKGWVPANSSSVDLGSNAVECAAELIRNDGTSTILCAGNGKLFKLSGGALVQLTYGGGGVAPTITTNLWQTAALNDRLVFFQRGYDPLVYDPAVSTTTFRRISEQTSYAGTAPQAHCVVSAYGRIWAADTTSNKNTIYWTDTLTTQVWSTGTAGSLDLTGVWPSGGDQIVALAAHNNFLFIFGHRQILIYSGADDPTTMILSDSINNIGCVVRDSVQSTGEDVIFLSDSGVRSLMRVVQEKSAPIRTVSRNVNDDIQQYVDIENGDEVISAYSPNELFYLLTFKNRGVTYCFDMRSPLQDGSSRTTTWTNITPKCYLQTQSRQLYLGQTGYLGLYSGYDDNGTQYRMVYYTSWLDFGKPVALIILKKLVYQLIGARGQPVVIKWGFDYNYAVNADSRSLTVQSFAEYGISEYGIDEYNPNVMLNRIDINASGSGKLAQLGFEALVNQYALAIQKIEIYGKEGRI